MAHEPETKDKNPAQERISSPMRLQIGGKTVYDPDDESATSDAAFVQDTIRRFVEKRKG